MWNFLWTQAHRTISDTNMGTSIGRGTTGRWKHCHQEYRAKRYWLLTLIRMQVGGSLYSEEYSENAMCEYRSSHSYCHAHRDSAKGVCSPVQD